MNDMISPKITRVVLSPMFMLSVGLMIINDHVLKGAGVLHSSITGKISDFAFLFFVPIIVAYLFRVNTVRGLSSSYLTVGVLFAAINLSPFCSRLIESLFHLARFPLVLWPDPTDLIALTMLPCSFAFVVKEHHAQYVQPMKCLECGVVLVCVLTCVATSPVRRPTHEPLYMPWNDLRSSGEVLPPQEILKRGKIYIKDNYLYINEPNKGIHIFENSNPKKPVPKGFLHIPGNTDLSIKGSYLYADSFVDLVVFALTLYPEDIILVHRVKDVFPYNPHQTQPLTEFDDGISHMDFYPAHVDKRKGVVTGWRRIQER